MSMAYRRREGDVPSAPMRPRLRQVTAELHRSAERHFGLESRAWDQRAYRAMLERLWGFYAPLENALMRLDWRRCAIRMEVRCKRAWLESDLVSLGAAPEDLSRLEACGALPCLEDVPEGLGALYVVEGSTLGGQVILRTLQDILDISPRAGGLFFSSYGRGTGAMWRDYLDVMEDVARTPRAAHAIERAAVETFAAFDHWMDQGRQT